MRCKSLICYFSHCHTVTLLLQGETVFLSLPQLPPGPTERLRVQQIKISDSKLFPQKSITIWNQQISERLAGCLNIFLFLKLLMKYIWEIFQSEESRLLTFPRHNALNTLTCHSSLIGWSQASHPALVLHWSNYPEICQNISCFYQSSISPRLFDVCTYVCFFLCSRYTIYLCRPGA